ncbi:hypothetical protein [Trichoplusia ni ascovirus 2c]|uniref:Putative matrix metalloproteinase n=1 Tax=Trichoplusia ni ascovirus 2c TaxID=328615 RepID=MMP_TNAVC|nr:hypothetical protein TNAV2c_gp158 [Trichoplusia ni ascovirus 2c]Q06VC5.1 RecName: Full=Putative matrix metalloproteinase; Flags: Precursor [Trichoplusia ni ascovirus 2c]ABF70673.1 hypothetical protein [Trichoplusia ni ascovirus 2c]AUS94266.1 zinc-dependent metalloprotease [Trichoplusia ni ascovirus 6b]
MMPQYERKQIIIHISCVIICVVVTLTLFHVFWNDNYIAVDVNYDVPYNFSVSPDFGFNTTNITWSLKPYYKYDINDLMNTANSVFKIWSRTGLNFTYIKNVDEAMVRIYFYRQDHNDSFPFDGKGKILGHAFYPNRHRINRGLAGEVHIDADEQFYFNDKLENMSEYDDSINLHAILLHEVGHAIGLLHSANKSSIMYPYYGGSKLGVDDFNGIQQIYFANKYKHNKIFTYNKYHKLETTSSSTPSYYGNRDRYPINKKRSLSSVFNITTTTVKPSYDKNNTFTPQKICFNITSSYKTHNTKLTAIRKYCTGHIDTISVIRGELYIFVDEYHWRFRSNGLLYSGYPLKTTHSWSVPIIGRFKVTSAFETLTGDIVIGVNYTTFYYFDRMSMQLYRMQKLPLHLLPRCRSTKKTIVFSIDSHLYALCDRIIREIDFNSLRMKRMKTKRSMLGFPLVSNLITVLDHDGIYLFRNDNTYAEVIRSRVDSSSSYFKNNTDKWTIC